MITRQSDKYYGVWQRYCFTLKFTHNTYYLYHIPCVLLLFMNTLISSVEPKELWLCWRKCFRPRRFIPYSMMKRPLGGYLKAEWLIFPFFKSFRGRSVIMNGIRY